MGVGYEFFQNRSFVTIAITFGSTPAKIIKMLYPEIADYIRNHDDGKLHK